MPRLINGLLLACLVGMPMVSWAESSHHDMQHAHSSSPSEEALQHATEALARFRDAAVAQTEGYVHYDGRDTFMMGEHWVNRQVLRSGQCEITRPSHLQYLVIDGQRTLIGVGYICGTGTHEAPAPLLFGADVSWHTHGPAFCFRAQRGGLDMQAWAEALPNALTSLTWQELCRQWSGQPVQWGVSMLHTWNWIPHPQGTFVHENPAIPFLRASLSVPDQEFLDSADGQAALATLRLVHGDIMRRYRGAFPVVNATPAQRQQTEEIVADAVRQGTEALAQMRTGEAQHEQQLYLEGAHRGAQVLAHMQQNVLRVFSPEQQEVLAAFLASLHVREHTHREHQQSAER
jgi:hypothetical protein